MLLKDETCACTEDGYCQRYKRDMNGQMRAICAGRGEGVTPEQAAAYRDLWTEQASVVVQDNALALAVGCPFAGEELRTEAGRAVTRDCQSCGGNGRVRLKVFPCKHPAREPEEVTARDCQECLWRPRQTEGARKLKLVNHLSPGDVLTMTAAVYSLHKAHPGKFLIAVDTTCPSIFDFSPDVVPADETFEEVQTHYPLINECNQRAVHVMQGYCQYLEDNLGIRVPLMTNRPMLYISNREKTWMDQVQETTGLKRKFWVINAGTKSDFTAKQYPFYQEVVDRLQGKILFVQIGKKEHLHRPLRGVIDLLDRTDDRQLIRLVYNSEGVFCGTTFLMHIAAGLQKPAVVLAGGREPRQWNTYPLGTLLSTVGSLPCCRTEACWRSRTMKLGDGGEQDGSVCEQPVLTDPPAPRCMAMIAPEEVCAAILRYQT
jgi:hypothetical protein